MVERCDYVLPSYVGHHHELDGTTYATCRLRKGHDGAHLVVGAYAYIEWERAAECPEPEECREYISCQHFDFWVASLEEAIGRLVKDGPPS